MTTPPAWVPDPLDDRRPTPPPVSGFEPPTARDPFGAPNSAPQYGEPQYGAPHPQYGAPQYGAPPSGADPYGAPAPGTAPGATPYGYGTGYAYGAGNTYAAQRTSGLAIASLVTSLSSIVFSITAPVGLILGIVALNGIKRDGTQGRGLAIAGIAVGAVMTLVMVGSIVVLIAVFAGIAATPFVLS